MRSILNISLPLQMVREVKREVKRGGYASVSEYIRHLIRERQELQLLKELKQEEIEGMKVLTSLKDLLD